MDSQPETIAPPNVQKKKKACHLKSLPKNILPTGKRLLWATHLHCMLL